MLPKASSAFGVLPLGFLPSTETIRTRRDVRPGKEFIASRQSVLIAFRMSSEFNILTPNAMLGYGYRVEHFWYGIEKFAPKAIIVDSGSTDGGPYKLGLSKMTCGRDSYIRDLTPILQACFHRKIQVLIGSVGGDGSDKHVQEMFEIVQEIAAMKGFSFKIATISAGFERNLLKRRIVSQKVGPCGPVEELTVEGANSAIDIVAQMGAEPYVTRERLLLAAFTKFCYEGF